MFSSNFSEKRLTKIAVEVRYSVDNFYSATTETFTSNLQTSISARHPLTTL